MREPTIGVENWKVRFDVTLVLHESNDCTL